MFTPDRPFLLGRPTVFEDPIVRGFRFLLGFENDVPRSVIVLLLFYLLCQRSYLGDGTKRGTAFSLLKHHGDASPSIRPLVVVDHMIDELSQEIMLNAQRSVENPPASPEDLG